MDADIACAADKRVGHRTLEPQPPARLFGAADNDMGDIARRRVPHDFLGLIGARPGDRLTAQMFRETQGRGDPVAGGLSQMHGSRRFDIERHPRRTEAVSEARGIAHQRSAAGMIVDADKHPVASRPGTRYGMRLHMGQQLLVNPLCRAAKRELTKGRQVSGRKIVLDRPLRRVRHIDLAVMQPFDQVIGRQVDDLYIVGAIDDRIGNRFAYADTGDLGDDVVQAFDMLDVERRIDVDAAREQFLHIHIAFGMTAAGRVGMRQFVDQDETGTPRNDGVNVHFIENAALVVDRPTRHHLQAIDQRLGFLAAVSLDDADDDIDPVGFARMGRGQHFKGLADTGRCTQKNFQAAAGFPLRPRQERVRRWSAIHVAAVISHQMFGLPPRATESGTAPLSLPALSGRDSFIKRHVQRQDVDGRFTENAEFAGLNGLVYHRADLTFVHAAGLGDARHLEIGRFRRDMRVETTTRRGDQVHRYGGTGVRRLESVRFRFDPVKQLRIGRAEIRTARCGGIVAISRSGGATMEIAICRKDLADQRRADDGSILFDQAAIGLVREQGLGDARHAERIGKTGDERDGNDHDKGWSQLFQHE